MPIRKDLRHHYRGPAWRAIRKRILERAFDCCEFCGAPNGRDVVRAYSWWAPANERAESFILNGGNKPLLWRAPGMAMPGVQYLLPMATAPSFCHYVKIVVGIAHLNQDASDMRDENLAALCQWCHLHHDAYAHLATIRRAWSERVGQGWLDDTMRVAIPVVNGTWIRVRRSYWTAALSSAGQMAQKGREP